MAGANGGDLRTEASDPEELGSSGMVDSVDKPEALPLDHVGILAELVKYEREAFEKYRTYGHNYFGSPEARKRWEIASERLGEFLRWLRDISG